MQHLHLTERERKLISSLAMAKFRKRENLFVAEGAKLVEELLPHLTCRLLVGTPEWLSTLAIRSRVPIPKMVETTEEEFARWGISQWVTPRPLLALFEIPEEPLTLLPSPRILLLDGVQDPGNLGTLLRCADWFAIDQVWLSPGSADPFAPRAVQATMGALAHVPLRRFASYEDLASALPQGVEMIGAFLDGVPYFSLDAEALRSQGFVLVLGNEGNGISSFLESRVSLRTTIPALRSGACESLNVSTAGAILLSQICRPH